VRPKGEDLKWKMFKVPIFILDLRRIVRMLNECGIWLTSFNSRSGLTRSRLKRRRRLLPPTLPSSGTGFKIKPKRHKN